MYSVCVCVGIGVINSSRQTRVPGILVCVRRHTLVIAGPTTIMCNIDLCVTLRLGFNCVYTSMYKSLGGCVLSKVNCVRVVFALFEVKMCVMPHPAGYVSACFVRYFNGLLFVRGAHGERVRNLFVCDIK